MTEPGKAPMTTLVIVCVLMVIVYSIENTATWKAIFPDEVHTFQNLALFWLIFHQKG